MKEVILNIPMYAPSTNTMHLRNANGSLRLNPKHKEFRSEVAYSSYKAFKVTEYPVEVTAYLYMPDKRLRDADNTKKTILDALVRAGVIKDDNWKYVRRTVAEIVEVDEAKKGRTIVRISKYKGKEI